MSKKGRTRADDVAINDDGGPAFPYSALQPNEAAIALAGTMYADNVGMTLRDYFAGEALKPALAEFYNTRNVWEDHDDLAEHVYSVADAMLRAKRRRA